MDMLLRFLLDISEFVAPLRAINKPIHSYLYLQTPAIKTNIKRLDQIELSQTINGPKIVN